jgi:hypothetical protein
MAETEQIRQCAMAGINTQMHLQQLAEAVDDERGEAARRYLAEVLIDAGSMEGCGLEFERDEVLRHSWELMPLISPGVGDRPAAINKVAEISLALIDTTPENLTQLMFEEFGPDSI